MANIFNRLFKSSNNDKFSRQATEQYWKTLLSHLTINRVYYNADNDDNYIKQGYQQNPTVYSIINLINNAAKRVPYQILQVKDVGKAKSYKSMT